MIIITIKTNRYIDKNEYDFILSEIKKEIHEIDTVKIEPIHSFGLSDTEFIFSITISFLTSIAANLVYDCGKLIVKSLAKRGIKVNIQEEEKTKKKPNKRTGSIKYPLSGNNPALDILPDNFWQKMVIDINRAKGKDYEKLATFLIVNSLKEKLDISKLTILNDNEWFYCYEENMSKRRYDIFVKELLVGYEIKSYRVVYNSFVREQIQKDRWLLEHKKVNEVRWI